MGLGRENTEGEGILIPHIRLATKDEIDKVKEKSDPVLGHTQFLALDSDTGGVDIAVVRNCFEVNPIIYAEGTNDIRRAKFLWGLEERLLGAGIDRYYFQIDSSKEHYIKTVKHWGAEQVSEVPEFRFLKIIR